MNKKIAVEKTTTITRTYSIPFLTANVNKIKFNLGGYTMFDELVKRDIEVVRNLHELLKNLGIEDTEEVLNLARKDLLKENYLKQINNL